MQLFGEKMPFLIIFCQKVQFCHKQIILAPSVPEKIFSKKCQFFRISLQYRPVPWGLATQLEREKAFLIDG
jgi:hypothetical protein